MAPHPSGSGSLRLVATCPSRTCAPTDGQFRGRCNEQPFVLPCPRRRIGAVSHSRRLRHRGTERHRPDALRGPQSRSRALAASLQPCWPPCPLPRHTASSAESALGRGTRGRLGSLAQRHSGCTKPSRFTRHYPLSMHSSYSLRTLLHPVVGMSCAQPWDTRWRTVASVTVQIPAEDSNARLEPTVRAHPRAPQSAVQPA